MDILDSLDWAGDPQLTRILQESVLNNAAMGSCTRENVTTIVIILTSFLSSLPSPSAIRMLGYHTYTFLSILACNP